MGIIQIQSHSASLELLDGQSNGFTIWHEQLGKSGSTILIVTKNKTRFETVFEVRYIFLS